MLTDEGLLGALLVKKQKEGMEEKVVIIEKKVKGIEAENVRASLPGKALGDQ